MKFAFALVLCFGIATAALAGEGGERFCESCLNIDSIIYPTPAYQTVSGSTIGQPGSEYSYEFCGQQGGTYRFTFCEGGGFADYDSALSVQGPASCGAYLVCNDDFCSLQSQIDFTSGATAQYIVVVDGFSSGVGNYTLAYRGPECDVVPTVETSVGQVKALYR